MEKTLEETRAVTKHDPSFLKKFLWDMLLIRRFEEKAAQMYGLQKIGGFCHLYIGQEAVAVGSVACLDLEKDYILTSYRDHGIALAVGMDPGSLMAELYGKVTGCCKGKGGSMHFFDKGKNFLGGNGIVGAHIPLAAGAALKIKYNEEEGVVLCFFGDGAIHQGSFHETLNMARIWNLPVVYICENNQYGMGTDFRRVSSVHDFSIMGVAYGIEGKQVNGMDVLTVYEEVKECVQGVKDRGEPAFLEIKTYRYKGHSMSDPAKYRTREEVQQYKQQDPIQIHRDRLIDQGILTQEEYKDTDKKIRAICEEAVKFAEESDPPPLEELYTDILV